MGEEERRGKERRGEERRGKERKGKERRGEEKEYEHGFSRVRFGHFSGCTASISLRGKFDRHIPYYLLWPKATLQELL